VNLIVLTSGRFCESRSYSRIAHEPALIDRGNRTVVGEYFPFVHFISVVVIPFMYWVACIELGVYDSNENQFSLTFGQVSVSIL